MSNRGKIALVIAGGQMCMRLNPQTDIRQPTLPVEEMLSWLPEEQREKLFVVDWSRQPSSHYTLRMTGDLIQILSKSVVDGAGGLVVTCGTDAIEEMAYLTDLYWAYPQPVIFTASHHPFYSIGSDAPLNLCQSVLAALSGECWGMGVLVCLQDQLFAASEITETANQRRCSFLSPDRGPLGQFIGNRVDILRQHRRSKVLEESSPPARDVEILYASLGGGDRILELLVPDEKRQLDGLVIAAFGGGNVPPSWVPYIKKLGKEEVPVVIVSRCQKGHTLAAPNSFEGSMKRLLEIGVLDGGPLSPMQARIKLAAGLGAGLRKAELQNYLLEE